MARNNSSTEAVTIDMRPLMMPIAIVLSAIIIGVCMILGASVLGSNLTIGGSTSTPPVAADPTVPDTTPSIVTVSVDDDAVKGNLETAKVVVVEFSDYECPFCQSFFNETLPSIQSTYIDSGEVAFIYRDLPLSFHEPAASLAANIMECTRAQGGDSAYYQMHDYWFQNSISNGSGLRVPDSYVAFADSIGLSGSQVKSCADAATYADEIAADSAAAASVGIQGTPGFVVGVMDADGNVTGDFINGAYPFATFQTTIDKYLNQ